jgi:hypothetical protein
VVPFSLSAGWALITRTELPVIVQPPKKSGDQWSTGLGNGCTTFFLSPAYGSGFYWGAGPLIYYPSTNASVGVDRWGSRPSVAFLKKDASPYVFGTVVNNIWSFGGPSSSGKRTNSLLINPIVSYHFGKGLVRRLVPEHHQQLAGERRQMDRPGRRRLQQDGSAWSAADKACTRFLLQ